MSPQNVIIIMMILIAATRTSRVRRQGFIDLSSGRCRSPRGEAGTCISIRKCPPLLNLLLTQRQQLDVADFLRKSVCGYEGSDPKVCCPVDSNITTAKPKTSESFDTTNPAETRGETGLFPIGKCGINDLQHTRVVGGVNATLGSWPWMAALGYQSNQGGTSPVFLCGGSLISSTYILTAAHCLASNRKLTIARLGDLNLYEDTDGANPIDARVSKIFIHEKYNPTTFTNDIALIRLTRPVPFNNHIKPICLPLTSHLRAKDYVSRKPFIAGWGTTSYNGPSSAVLLDLQLPVVPEEKCKETFAPYKTVIDKRVLCAGYLEGGKDACRGDSGGPLMDFNNEDKLFYQIGVVSYGYKCAEKGFPGVYTRVAEFVDWIVDTMEKARLE